VNERAPLMNGLALLVSELVLLVSELVLLVSELVPLVRLKRCFVTRHASFGRFGLYGAK
jgi:hypothetical protein